MIHFNELMSATVLQSPLSFQFMNLSVMFLFMHLLEMILQVGTWRLSPLCSHQHENTTKYCKLNKDKRVVMKQTGVSLDTFISVFRRAAVYATRCFKTIACKVITNLPGLIEDWTSVGHYGLLYLDTLCARAISTRNDLFCAKKGKIIDVLGCIMNKLYISQIRVISSHSINMTN